jgi:hypothetical protein
MAGRGKFVELIDITKFGLPNVLMLKAELTASNMVERAAGGGFMSYGQMWQHLPLVVRGLASDEFILSAFTAYKAGWKNAAIQRAFRLLRDYFGGKGNWYRMPNKNTYILGFWFKTSIKGFWVHNGKSYAVLINARKGQPLSSDDVRFLARGVYELHCRDNPNNPIPLIIDLGQHPADEERQARAYEVPPEEAVSLDAFETSVREFLVALNLAGISQPPPPEIEHILDLFRGP